MKEIAAFWASLTGVVALTLFVTAASESGGLFPGLNPAIALALFLIMLVPPVLPALYVFRNRIFRVGKKPYVVVTEWLAEHPRVFWFGYSAYVILLLTLAILD